jgi:hypothetical protein
MRQAILYAADTGIHRIRKVMSQGDISTAVGSANPCGIAAAPQRATLGNPVALTVLPAGQLVIVDDNALLLSEGL